MPWEERSGRWYYYRKRREGGRVVSEYIGTGFMAEVAANLDETERNMRQYERDLVKAEMEDERAAAKEVDQLSDLVRAITTAALLITGHHTHKGQWRCRRE